MSQLTSTSTTREGGGAVAKTGEGSATGGWGWASGAVLVAWAALACAPLAGWAETGLWPRTEDGGGWKPSGKKVVSFAAALGAETGCGAPAWTAADVWSDYARLSMNSLSGEHQLTTGHSSQSYTLPLPTDSADRLATAASARRIDSSADGKGACEALLAI